MTTDGAEAIAIGARQSGTSYESKSLILRWNGRRWYTVPSPVIAHSVLTSLAGVALASPSDGWTVGESDSGTTPQTLIEHWNGKKWTVVANPNLNVYGSSITGSYLTDVAAISPADVMVTGYVVVSGVSQPVVLRWNGAHWTAAKTPNPAPAGAITNLTAIAGSAATGFWILGDYLHGRIHSFALHRS